MVYYQQVSYGLDVSKDRCSVIRLAVLKSWGLTKICTITDNSTLLTKYLRANPTEHKIVMMDTLKLKPVSWKDWYFKFWTNIWK